MKKILVQDYLVDHTFQQLEDDHGVCARLNAKRDKFSLNYDQILVKNGDPLAEQCRGLVLRPEVTFDEEGWKDRVVGLTEPLAWPMDRFYNYGDGCAVSLDWSDLGLRVYEKLDGTMIVLYWDPLHEKWHAATRAVSEADLPIHKDSIKIGDTTFSGLFWTALEMTYDELNEKSGEPYDFEGWVNSFDKQLTYVFELTSPHNRVVVKYNKPRVTLLAVRHTKTGVERCIEEVANQLRFVPVPKSWPIQDVSALVAFVDQSDPSQLEGAVAVDSKFQRIKVKNKAWVLSSRAKDLVTVSRRSALEAIILSKLDDILPLLEADIANQLLEMQNALKEYFKQIDANFVRFKHMAGGSRKLFAEQVMLSDDLSAPHFKMWENKVPNTLTWAVQQAELNRLSPSILDAILTKIS